MKKLILPIVILVIFVACYFVFFFFNSPLKNNSSSSLFVVKQGESVRSIAEHLKREGYIKSDLFFISLARMSRNARSIKSGQYNLFFNMKNTEILHILKKGMVATEKFTVPEGYSIKQIANYLEKNGIVSAEQFVDACYSKDILIKYKIPFESTEGYLFPDTYIVAKDLSATQLVELMIKKFYENMQRIPHSKYNEAEMKKVIIIASLVEKEAKIDSERPLIAAVFFNRLSKGKRLESCATVQYILGETKERLLYSDLRIESPYNTYLHTGLPPGPIANPGFKSLYAALHPADVDYLFFVSKRDGSHHFSSTYQEHLRAIEKYSELGKVGHQVS